MNRGAAELLDIFFPRKCPVCGRIAGAERICPECRASLIPVRPPVCAVCGTALFLMPAKEDASGGHLRVEQAAASLCPSCQAKKRAFDGVRSAFLYEDPAKEMMLRLKYHGARENAEIFAALTAGALMRSFRAVKPDVLVPVPVHKKRLKKRGYNQAELLARALSERTGIPCRTDWVLRTGSTKAQKELNPAERIRNLQNAFAPGPGIKKSSTVLLIDDIYTTGATLEAVSRVLKRAGVRRVYGFTMCTGESSLHS